MSFDFDVAVFDMDGTLIDSMSFWRLSAIEYLLARGIPVTPDDLAGIYDHRCGEIIAAAVTRAGGNPDELPPLMPDLLKYMERHYAHDVILKPGAAEYLEKLKSEDKRLVLATATPLKYGKIGLEHTGIADKFDYITDTDEIGVGKGSPDFYYRLADKLGVEPQRCVMFEDAAHSIRSAKAAGFHTIGIEEVTGNKHRDEVIAMTDMFIRDFRELM